MSSTNTPGNLNGRKSGYTNTTQVLALTASFAIEESHGGKLLQLDTAVPSQVQLTDTVGPGFSAVIMQAGAGQVSFISLPGIVVRSRDDRTNLAGQYACAEITCTAPGEWLICGDVVSGG